jgi:hypothetical protein
MQRNCVNPDILAAFLSVYHCPFLHTCGIYSHDLQNTLSASNANDNLCQGEGKIAPLFVEKVHWGEYYHVPHVVEEAPQLVCGLPQIWETLQVLG